MSKRSAQQRFVAWAALAAMALIVLVPVISRAMPMNVTMAGMASSMDAGRTMHDAHTAHRSHGTPRHPDDPTARCGYCVLFLHMSAVGFDTPVMFGQSMLLAWVVERYGLRRWARASAFLGPMHR